MAAVTSTLIEFGVIAPHESPRYHIGVTHGDTLWFDAFRQDGTFFHAKVAEYVTLSEEVRVYGDAFAIYGQFMPKPVGHAMKEHLEIFVSEGVEPRALWANPLERSWRARRLRSAFWRFFQFAGRTRSAPLPGEVHQRLLEALTARFALTRFAPVIARWSTEGSRRELAMLGAIPQHCDFVVNNIGTRGSGLVVYDWEDFGKASIPGLDLCTLAMSLLQRVAPDAGFRREGPYAEPMRLFLKPACEALGMSLDQFWDLVPLYLLTFLYLKQAYASGVRKRTERLLDDHCGLGGRT